MRNARNAKEWEHTLNFVCIVRAGAFSFAAIARVWENCHVKNVSATVSRGVPLVTQEGKFHVPSVGAAPSRGTVRYVIPAVGAAAKYVLSAMGWRRLSVRNAAAQAGGSVSIAKGKGMSCVNIAKGTAECVCSAVCVWVRVRSSSVVGN